MILDSFKLNGCTAMVTGCRLGEEGGIGYAMALALAEAGADIIGVGSQIRQSPSRIEREVRGAGRAFTPYACDLGDRRATYDLIARIKANHPRVDILVNNAGTTFRAPSAEFPDGQWDRVMEINLNVPFILARELGKEMLARGWGKVIFTASLMSFQGGYTIPAYTASKGGVSQLVMALSNEWAGKGVNVNAIAPGYVDTELTAALKNDPARYASILGRIPAGRWASPRDFQGVAVFLASHASDYVNGVTIPVDGGWLGR